MALKQVFALTMAVVVSACATRPVDPNRPVSPSCDQSVRCFYESSVRSFRVIDDRTLIVMVGGNQCPYKIELDGFFCDISMSSFIAFDDPDGRICTWDRSYVAAGPFSREGESCRVTQVTPMTDDELLEVYATKGLTPPLPAKGSGELEVEEVPPEASSTAAPPEGDRVNPPLGNAAAAPSGGTDPPPAP